jgi:hypothetical protein
VTMDSDLCTSRNLSKRCGRRASRRHRHCLALRARRPGGTCRCSAAC